jgi:chitin synthase
MYIMMLALNAGLMFLLVRVSGVVMAVYGGVFTAFRLTKTLGAFVHGNGPKPTIPKGKETNRARSFFKEFGNGHKRMETRDERTSPVGSMIGGSDTSVPDKLVVCFVPVYTEGEDELRRTLAGLVDSVYDNKRKLVFFVCDGVVVGSGNDRLTAKILLDICGVDPKIDPPALPFRSVATGSGQLNYGKVYSGLFGSADSVVPYLIIVKVGTENEQTKAQPGNRGKRDSQLLLLSFLHRVHHQAPMNPLELEIFHQLNNIIGVDPELYEYLYMVDSDTVVHEDALPILVNICSNDEKIGGICGEVQLIAEERSWWTMAQVYEYYNSFHLHKSFESLFGGVTCLPGWYRDLFIQ